ncbi:hypothetical protein BVY01_00130 [bacterium I07]|nr:hypothetical protein BVY01_00130 [bacterium I07]
MGKKLFLVIGFLFLMQGCSQDSDNSLSSDERATISDAIEKQVNGYFEAVNRHDVDWLLAFWADVDEFAMWDDGKLSTGYDSIEKGTRDWFAGLTTVLHSEHSNGNAFALDKALAIYTTQYDWGIVTTSGDTVRCRGPWTYVFRPFDGGWKVVYSYGSRTFY